MIEHALDELRGRLKDQSIKLIEVGDLTRQIAAAAERKDSMSVQLLLSERETPIRELLERKEGIAAYLEERPEEEAIRLYELLKGAEPEREAERGLAEEVARFSRALDSVMKLDRELSLRMCGSRSFYNLYRE